jgi:hypothetical protein
VVAGLALLKVWTDGTVIGGARNAILAVAGPFYAVVEFASFANESAIFDFVMVNGATLHFLIVGDWSAVAG